MLSIVTTLLAQVAAEPTFELKAELGRGFVQYVLPGLLTAISGVLVAALGVLGMWLREKAKTSKVFNVMYRAEQIALNVVAHVDVELRPEIVKAASDGKITPTEAIELKAKAMELFKKAAGEDTLAELKSAGLGGGVLETFISGLIERALAQYRGGAPVSTPVPASP